MERIRLAMSGEIASTEAGTRWRRIDYLAYIGRIIYLRESDKKVFPDYLGTFEVHDNPDCNFLNIIVSPPIAHQIYPNYRGGKTLLLGGILVSTY